MYRAHIAATAMMLVTVLAACGTPNPGPASAVETTTQPVRIASLKGPTTMGLVSLMDDAAAGGSAYEVSIHGTADEVLPLLIQAERDIALLPANLAAVLYQRTQGTSDQITVLAINTLGVLHVVEAGSTVQSMEDLRGRTVYSTGKGTTPEYVLNYVLTANGMTPGDDVAVVFVSEATQVAAMLASETGAVGVLPQPYVTVVVDANPEVRMALDLTEEWDKISTESQLVTGVVVVRAAFAAEHPDAVSQFLLDYRASTDFTNTHPKLAAPLIVEAGLAPNVDIAERAIASSHITFIDGAQMRQVLGGYLDVLFAADPASVGGSVPGDDFYYSD